MGRPEHLEATLRRAVAATTARSQALQKAVRQTQNLTTAGAAPQGSVRRDLVMQIEELNNTLQYMGEAHPRRRNELLRLEQLKLLLQRWDQTVRVQQGLPKGNGR